MKAVTARPNMRGFDCNQPLLPEQARAFREHGYDFVVRYLPRVTQAAHDLTSEEVYGLLRSGLQVMPVQHVESAESWSPSAEKGYRYGTTAAQRAFACGFRQGCTVWLDLEGVAVGTLPQTVIDYCREWYDAVKAFGFEPGIYVGWHCGLTAWDLYYPLPFTRYWGAYNLNADEFPAVRGLCMKQSAAKPSDYPPKAGVWEIDVNVIRADKLGGLPTLLAADAGE